jgi:hydrogenase maturation protein HypF
MSTNAAFGAFEKIIADFRRLYDIAPARVACDAHPDYRTTRFAEEIDPSPRRIQHHVAHVFSCMAENELAPPVLGVSWDGTGYGTDGTVWGGELIRVSRESVERVGHLRTFPLPGGEQAIREPRRAAAGLLYEVFGEAAFAMDNAAPILAFSPGERRLLLTMLRKGVNAPRTSSAGRLFDAVASITGIRHETNFEGQAAMELEFALSGVDTRESYPFDALRRNGVLVLDWAPLIRSVLADVAGAVAAAVIAARFHNTLAEMIAQAAARIGEKRVLLTGGCFQNRYLTEAAVARLEEAGCRAYWHQRVPPNDGGIALGQIAAMEYFDSRGGKD